MGRFLPRSGSVSRSRGRTPGIPSFGFPLEERVDDVGGFRVLGEEIPLLPDRFVGPRELGLHRLRRRPAMGLAPREGRPGVEDSRDVIPKSGVEGLERRCFHLAGRLREIPRNGLVASRKGTPRETRYSARSVAKMR